MRLAIFTLCMAAAAEEPVLNGKWHIERSAAGRESTQDCTFTQNGQKLSGSCTSRQGDVKLQGKVTGKSVTWTFQSDSEGGAVTVVYAGQMETPTKITGKVVAVEFGVEGQFTATATK